MTMTQTLCAIRCFVACQQSSTAVTESFVIDACCSACDWVAFEGGTATYSFRTDVSHRDLHRQPLQSRRLETLL